MPTDGHVVAHTVTKTITVDLSGYDLPVNLRIVVGDVTLFDGAVDAETVSKPATASGTQMVYIYIDGTMVERYSVDFTQ